MSYYDKCLARRSAIDLALAGAATITFDQHMRAPKIMSTRSALAADYAAVLQDVKRSTVRIRHAVR